MKSNSELSEDSMEIFMRITHAAKPYFARFAAKPIGPVQERFPKTAKMLFEIALGLADGKYGAQFRDEVIAIMEGTAYPTPDIIELLQQAALYCPLLERPEILNRQLALVGVSDVDLEGLMQLFHEYLANLITPSHLTVHMLLDNRLAEKAFNVAFNLRNPREKGRALVEMIAYALNDHRLDKAVKYFDLIPPDYERRGAMDRIILELLEVGQIERAIAFGTQLNKTGERVHAMQVLAVWLAKNQRLGQGLALVHKYLQNSQKDYILSLIVRAAAGRNNFEEAKKIAFGITDRGYRQDGLEAIVKKLVGMRKIADAQAFVEQLGSVKEREEAGRVVESAMASFQRDERIRSMQKRISPKVV